jgi:hypothetical protein
MQISKILILLSLIAYSFQMIMYCKDVKCEDINVEDCHNYYGCKLQRLPHRPWEPEPLVYCTQWLDNFELCCDRQDGVVCGRVKYADAKPWCPYMEPENLCHEPSSPADN